MVLTIYLGVIVSLLGSDAADLQAWHASYALALQEVRNSDKPLFIVFEPASTVMDKWARHTLFVNREVQQALSADYIRMFVNTETEMGRELAEQFGVDQFPRVVVIDRSGGWQVYRKSGEHTSEQVLAILNEYRRTKIV